MPKSTRPVQIKCVETLKYRFSFGTKNTRFVSEIPAATKSRTKMCFRSMEDAPDARKNSRIKTMKIPLIGNKKRYNSFFSCSELFFIQAQPQKASLSAYSSSVYFSSVYSIFLGIARVNQKKYPILVYVLKFRKPRNQKMKFSMRIWYNEPPQTVGPSQGVLSPGIPWHQRQRNGQRPLKIPIR